MHSGTGGGAGAAVGGESKKHRNAAQDAKLTAAEFELHRQMGPSRCTHAVGAELIVNTPDYVPLPSGAKVVVQDRDHGPPPTYTIRFQGQADMLQGALSGAEAGTEGQVVAGVLEKYLRHENVLTTARNCAGNQSIENILRSSLQYTVPLFQRKYCWQLEQWRTLWKDIRQLAANPSHHMGKLVIYEEPNALVLETAREQLDEALQDTEYQQFSAFSSARHGMSRAVQAAQLMVVDGQQRLTTTCIILAALRDVAEMVAERQGGAQLQAQAAALATATNALLFREDAWFVQYQERASSGSQEAAAGSEDTTDLLEWFCSHSSFLPTHDDRSSYCAAVLPRSVVPQGLSQHRRSTVSIAPPGVGAAPSAGSEDTATAQAESEVQGVGVGDPKAGRPSYILDCKRYYVEQAVGYVSSPTMDEEAAEAAIARLAELSARVRRRLKYVFFELPSVSLHVFPQGAPRARVDALWSQSSCRTE